MPTCARASSGYGVAGPFFHAPLISRDARPEAVARWSPAIRTGAAEVSGKYGARAVRDAAEAGRGSVDLVVIALPQPLRHVPLTVGPRCRRA
ncbi:hypothetical protein GCM10018952_12490 [Streptosporangium vulgare]